MRLIILSAVMAALLCVTNPLTAAPPNDWAVATAPVAAAVVAAEPADNPQGTIRLTFRERRKLGLTFRNIRNAVAELDAAGELDRNDPAGTSLQVLEKILTENPQAVKAVAGERDWASFLDALMAFLERLLSIWLTFM